MNAHKFNPLFWAFVAMAWLIDNVLEPTMEAVDKHLGK